MGVLLKSSRFMIVILELGELQSSKCRLDIYRDFEYFDTITKA